MYCHSARNGWEEAQDKISWKKNRSQSGGHLYHHIHELDCIQFIMGEPETVTMTGGNVAHNTENFGDEEDMLLVNLEFANNTYAVLEYGSAFRWSEHYLLIQGTKGAIKLDLQEVKMILKTEHGEELFLVHETKEEDDNRTAIYRGSQMDGAIKYGKPGSIVPAWLQTIMESEMIYFHDLLNGETPTKEFERLLTGEAARSSIATADACTLSLKENRKVNVSEVMKK